MTEVEPLEGGHDGLALVALALTKLPGIGRRRVRRALGPLRQADVPAGEAGREALGFALSALSLPAPTDGTLDRAWDAALRVRDRCWEEGWQVWVIGGPGYPAPLTRLADPPVVLFAEGPPLAAERPHLAIVGTREPTPWGRSMAAACARVCAENGAIVVSGLAAGIDSEAHWAVVNAGGRTWATLPGGLDRIYPPGNRGLSIRIVEGGGTLVTEYWPGSAPRPQRFIERDRLQVGLSSLVLVIEMGRTGGTHHTVRCARATDVPVWTTLPDDAGTGPTPSAQLGTRDLWRAGSPQVTPADLLAWIARARVGAAAPDAAVVEAPRLF